MFKLSLAALLECLAKPTFPSPALAPCLRQFGFACGRGHLYPPSFAEGLAFIPPPCALGARGWVLLYHKQIRLEVGWDKRGAIPNVSSPKCSLQSI